MKEIISNEFEDEVVVISSTTLVRLFALHSDAVTLYMFYIKNAKIQKTNSVWANNKFCKTGLGWGSERLRNTKKILRKNGFITPRIHRDKHGIITKHYVKLHYFMNSHRTQKPHGGPTHAVGSSTDGSQDTNAYNKKLNALDKNVNTNNKKENNIVSLEKKLEEKNKKIVMQSSSLSGDIMPILQDDIYNHWNKYKLKSHRKLVAVMRSDITKAINRIVMHNSFNDRFLHFNNVKSKVTLEMIKKAVDILKEGISNYAEILSNPNYFFNYEWNFHNFIKRGVSELGIQEERGFWGFLSSNNPQTKFLDVHGTAHRKIAKSLDLLTLKYEERFPLDKAYNTYMGINTDDLKYKYIAEDIFELVLPLIKKKEFEYIHFKGVERAIVSAIFKREDVKLLTNLVTLQKRMRHLFVKDREEELKE